MRECRAAPPDLFVIDLSRLPSQGLEIAIALRNSPATRKVPIIFCGGAQAKVQKTREYLPDAEYCELASLRASIKNVLTGQEKI